MPGFTITNRCPGLHRHDVNEAVRRREQSARARGVLPPEPTPEPTPRLEPSMHGFDFDLHSIRNSRLLINELTTRETNATIAEAALYRRNNSYRSLSRNRVAFDTIRYADLERWSPPREQAIDRWSRRADSMLHGGITEQEEPKPVKQQPVQMAFTFKPPNYIPTDFSDLHVVGKKVSCRFEYYTDDMILTFKGSSASLRVSNLDMKDPESLLNRYNAIMAYKKQIEEKKDVRANTG